MASPHEYQPSSANDSDQIRAAVSRFGAEALPRMHGDGRMEDRIREPVYNLLKALAGTLGRGIVVHDEVLLDDISAIPDFAVDVAMGRAGYIELKSQQVGIPENWNHPRKHDRDQWRKFGNLPNVIYTDGIKWSLYRNGQRWGKLAMFRGDLFSSGSKLVPADDEFEIIIREFLVWKPDRPATLRQVISEVAPLCRLLRHQVAETMVYERTSPEKKVFTTLANEWRETLFPSLTDDEFSDAYAQTVTFALLLARVDGVAFDNRSLNDIAGQLTKKHSLMGESLSILTNSRWANSLSVVDTLRRVVGNVDLDRVGVGEPGAYALLYETFLSDYDPKLRRKSGTYYTPDAVAGAMVRFTDWILKKRFGKSRGFAARDVYVIDPAMGTGTFLVAIIDSVVSTLRLESGTDAFSAANLSELFADRLIGFELQAAPFAVAEMRLHHTLKGKYNVELPRKEVRFLSNALDDPDQLPLPFGQLYDVLKENREEANRIKREQDVMVVIGNPPWRQSAKGEADWLEAPRDPKIVTPDRRERPSLDEFRSRFNARRAFNLSNMWTFFWRWAAWKVFEASPSQPVGIVALITPQAYMTSESYGGMRGYLRDTSDEGWIIDLTPEGFQPPTRTRIFPSVQQPICIGIFARYGAPSPKELAQVHYMAIDGEQQEKFAKLSAVKPDDPTWRVCPADREAPFLPLDPIWLEYPRLDDLLPWQQLGVTPNRNWVYAPDKVTLRLRWSKLIRADSDEKERLFKPTRDRRLDKTYGAMPGIPSGDGPLREESSFSPVIRSTGFRSFDRQYIICDRRVIDFPRRELWEVSSGCQIYVCEPPAYTFSGGPALTFSAEVPNVDYFMGHHGGQTLPLYRDPSAHEPNVAPELLRSLGELLGCKPSAEELLAYIAGVVAHPGFTGRFAEALRAPGIRVPISSDLKLWREAVGIGSEVLWVHTYGERYSDEVADRPHKGPSMAVDQRPWLGRTIPVGESSLRDEIEYDSVTSRIIVGAETMPGGPGYIGGVSPAVWHYSVGDMAVIGSWFDYRRCVPRHKKRTSDLDDINPTKWTGEFDDEFFALLNVIGRCVALESRQADLLDRICASPQITVADLERAGVFPVPGRFRDPPSSQEQDTLDLGDF